MQKGIRRQPKKKIVPASRLSVIQADVAGIDIGSREMFVCSPANEAGEREIRVYATTTEQIRNCVKWLKERNVRSVAMESTGVYWIPVLEIMELAGLEVVLADTRPVSRVPGRDKTDANDCEWLQTLHSHGMIQGAYRPAQQISELRTIVRTKLGLVRDQADVLRRMQKCLDQMNVRVHHAVRALKGATGMAMLRAIVGGERDPRKLVELRDRGCKKSKAEMIELLSGNWRSDHLFNLEQHLAMYDTLEGKIGVYEAEIRRRYESLTPESRKQAPVPPVANAAKRKSMRRRGQEAKREAQYRASGVDLTAIDGVGVETVEVVTSEYGVDLSRFPTEKAFIKHIGLAPHRPVTGGKVMKKAKRKEKGTRTAEALRNAATTLKQTQTAMGAYFRRIERRKNTGVAVFCTARKVAQQIYRMLRHGQDYVDIGQAAYQKQYEATRLRAMQKSAQQLGLKLVKIEAATA
jgi:transposase